MKTLIIEPTNQEDYRLFVDLAKRLHVKFREEKPASSKRDKQRKEDDFLSLYGSFEGIDAEMLIETIRDGQANKNIDISWAE